MEESVMKAQKPYTLLKRPPQGVWYYKLAGEKTRHSTGQTAKTLAERFVVSILKGETQQERSHRFGEFTKHLFVRGECDWIARSEQKGWIITREMAQMRRGHLVNHILPEFKDREVNSITSAEIDDWLLGLDVANATKNHIMDTFRIVMDEVKRVGLVKENAARQIKLFARNQRNRDILTVDEIKKLFPSETEKAKTIWQGPMWATFFYLLVTTGARLGEVQALTWNDWIPATSVNGMDAVLINKSLKNDKRIGPTKTGKLRVAFLQPMVLELLKNWKENSPNRKVGDLVFSDSGGLPLNRKWEKGWGEVQGWQSERILALPALNESPLPQRFGWKLVFISFPYP
jgi:integrase